MHTGAPKHVKLGSQVQIHPEGHAERGSTPTPFAPSGAARSPSLTTRTAAQATHGPPICAVRSASLFPTGHKLS